MKKIMIAALLITTVFASCKKDDEKDNNEYCWQLTDCMGNDVAIVCHKTESEVKDYVATMGSPGCALTYKKQ